MKKTSRLLSLSLVLLTSVAVAVGGCSSDDDSPGGGAGGSGSGGRGGAGGSGTGGSGTGGSGTGGSGSGGTSGTGGSGSGGSTSLDSGSGDSAPSDTGGGDTGASEGGSADGAGGDTPPAAGNRVSLNGEIAMRWTGARRTTSMENGVMVFTGEFQAGQIGGPSGHTLRIPIPPARESILEYKIRFDAGYDFSRGGKIPGLAGGSAPTGCVSTNGSGFSARMMWRENGKLIGYLYDNNQSSACGTGIDAGFNFKINQWYAIKQRVVLNTGRANNGTFQVWVDDRMVISRSNVSYMNEGPAAKVDWLLFHSFYGGSTNDWAPSRNTKLSFSEIYVTPVQK